MLRWLPVLIQVVLLLYCLVEAFQARPQDVRNIPRWCWIVVIILLPFAGPLAWLFFGRPRAESANQLASNRRPGQPLGPDDDPDFLRRLTEQRDQLKAHDDEPPTDGIGPRT